MADQQDAATSKGNGRDAHASAASASPGIYAGSRGKKIGGYELLEPIGSGGMGEVWLAEHELLGRLAAVKLIRPDVSSSAAGSAQAQKRFEREARATSALRSPHTIAIYDFGFTEQQTFYYAMELLEGISLELLVDRFGVVSPARAVHLLRGACESLSEAHQRGLIHRDIKPGNVFTCSMGLAYDFVKVLDFGLVKHIPSGAMSSLTAEGAIAGSPAFMPPEAVKGDFTEKADVYALGCLAFWLLTGRFVFQGATALEIMLGHVQGEPSPPSRFLADPLPSSLESLVMHCLKKAPEQRPTMKEVAVMLAECGALLPWTAKDAEQWWTEQRDNLSIASAAIKRAHDAKVAPVHSLRRPATWTERERASHVEAGVARLQHHFTKSHIDLAELELRIVKVKKAVDLEAFNTVFSDLPSLEQVQSVAVRPGRETDVDAVPIVVAKASALAAPEQRVVCVMGGVERKFPLEAGQTIKAVCVMGGLVLDLRDGRLEGAGVMEVQCVAVMGGIEIIVPPGTRVEVQSGGFLGAFEQQGRFNERVPHSGPLLRVTGVSVMGGVFVIERR